VALESMREQPRAVELLRRALEGGRVAHAYAFVGPAGAGRMTTARAFAQGLLCSGDREAGSGRGWPDQEGSRLRTPCGRCRGCALAASGQHPDLHVIAPTPPEKNPKGTPLIRIDAIRTLEREASLRPVLGGRRVLIIDDADRMTDDAPQAFLKFLEEPPPGVVVILVLAGVRALPATILSRCQIVRFQTRDVDRAATLVGETLALLETARAEGAPALFRRTERVDRERAEALVDGAWLLARDLLLARAGAPAGLLSDPARAEALAIEAARWTDGALVAMIEGCRRAREILINNVTPRLTVETVLHRLLARAA
jgi:DNA polymerase III delta subunit-like protein